MPIVINGSGTVTGLSAGGISNATAVASAAMPAGSIVQVVQATELDDHTSTTTSWADVSGMTVNITPSSASNKVLVQCCLTASADTRYAGFKLLRDSTDIAIGNADGSHRERITMSIGSNSSATNDNYCMRNRTITWLDSPSSTSALTYKLQWRIHHSTGNMYLNRVAVSSNDDEGWNARVPSTITVMEIKG